MAEVYTSEQISCEIVLSEVLIHLFIIVEMIKKQNSVYNSPKFYTLM